MHDLARISFLVLLNVSVSTIAAAAVTKFTESGTLTPCGSQTEVLGRIDMELTVDRHKDPFTKTECL